MAAVLAHKPQPPLGKMKRPSQPYVQTNTTSSRPGNPSPSPSTATKRLPGQTQTAMSPTSNAPLTNGVARPTRRPQRVQTRTNTIDGPGAERRTALKEPESYVPNETHILKKYKGNPPSLIVHLHPMHFRFDQQDGSFSYQSEMRTFIEHLQKKTIPPDMLEEFRKAGVKFYDGWLIVRVVDHKSVAKAAATTGSEAEDDKPFSIHNYNTFITPSAYVPYPKQQSTQKSPLMKQENGVASEKQTSGEHTSSSTINGEPGSDDFVRPSSKPGKPQPRVFHVALRPTNLSRHMDLVLASLDIDPKSALNRKQSQVFSARTPGGTNAMAAPLSLDTAAAGDKGPASKKRKLRIAPDQMIHFEKAVVNHTAAPLCLDLVNNLEEAEALMLSLRDTLYDQEPPSPKSRKRTVAELAADDALAKEQERFMLIMAERDGGGAGANTGVVDGQAAGGMFQPDFGKFNTIQQIKFQAAEKQKREEERRMHDDANKRLQEEERRQKQDIMRMQQQQAAQQQQAERQRQAQALEQRKTLQAAANAQQQQQQQQLQMQQQLQAQQAQQAQANAQQMSHLSGVPPNMQNQIRQGQPMSSPVVRQSTPHGNSSPIVGQTQAVAMSAQGSQQGRAGSPQRPASSMQHGHPATAMARGPSNQGPSRNGTPQIPHNTPGMRQATPVMRQGTPAQRMNQASPHPSMMVPTPQMTQAQIMANSQQMPNGMHYAQNAQHVAQMQARHNAMQQQAMPNGMMAGNPQLAQAQMAHIQAQRHANADQQAALMAQRQRAQAQAQAQAQMQQAQQQMGTPQQTAPSPANSAQQAQNKYSNQLRNQLQNQMQQVGSHASPTPSQSQPTTQQQMAQLQRQQQTNQMNAQMAQQGMQMSPQQQQLMRNAQMQQQMQQQMQFNNLSPQQQQQMAQQMMMQQARQAGQGGQPMNPQQMAAMQQQQRQAFPLQANMAKYRDQRIAMRTTELAGKKYGGNGALIQPQEHDHIRHMAIQEAQIWGKRLQAQQKQHQQQQQLMQAQQQGMMNGQGGMPGGAMNPQ